MGRSTLIFINCLFSSTLKFSVSNAALLAFNASAIINHDQDQQQGDVAQNGAVPNAQGVTNSFELLPLPLSLSV
jgi:hypothetical protein